MTPTPGLMHGWRRAVLAGFGLALTASAVFVFYGGLDASKERQEYLSKGFSGGILVALFAIGHGSVFASIYGALPSILIGKFGIEWPPPVDVLQRLETLAAENAELSKRLAEVHHQQQDEVARVGAITAEKLGEVCAAHEVTKQTLFQWILAHEPPPDDVEGADDETGDEERLMLMEAEYCSVDRQVSQMMMDGEDHDDGWGVDRWRQAAESARDAVEHERLRQAAVKRFPQAQPGPIA